MGIENLLGGLLDHLNEVPEPRQSGKIAYPLDEILFLTIWDCPAPRSAVPKISRES